MPDRDTAAVFPISATDLERLYTLLEHTRATINLAPDRWTSTTAGHLADSDWEALIRASSVVHRLLLWTKYAAVSDDSYLPTAPGARG